jgi:hypothetical protein
MFTDPLYSPYYSKYKGHYFTLLRVPYPDHAEVQCYSNPSIRVDGIVHICDLEEVR